MKIKKVNFLKNLKNRFYFEYKKRKGRRRAQIQ
jgi:hypothetical protein